MCPWINRKLIFLTFFNYSSTFLNETWNICFMWMPTDQVWVSMEFDHFWQSYVPLDNLKFTFLDFCQLFFNIFWMKLDMYVSCGCLKIKFEFLLNPIIFDRVMCPLIIWDSVLRTFVAYASTFLNEIWHMCSMGIPTDQVWVSTEFD